MSPILIDLAGNGFDLTDWRHGVKFELTPGQRSIISWTRPGSDDAWLVRDRNGNGKIDDGSELFGTFTEQVRVAGKPRNGFAALAMLDRNHDGVVDIKDPGFYDLGSGKTETTTASRIPTSYSHCSRTEWLGSARATRNPQRRTPTATASNIRRR